MTISWTPQLTKTHAESRRSTAKVQNERCCDTILWTWSRAPWCVWYPSSHNHGSGKWPHYRGNWSCRDPFSTSMILGGRIYSEIPMTHLLPRKNPSYFPLYWFYYYYYYPHITGYYNPLYTLTPQGLFHYSLGAWVKQIIKSSCWSFWRFRKRIVLFEVGHFIKTHLSSGYRGIQKAESPATVITHNMLENPSPSEKICVNYV